MGRSECHRKLRGATLRKALSRFVSIRSDPVLWKVVLSLIARWMAAFGALGRYDAHEVQYRPAREKRTQRPKDETPDCAAIDQDAPQLTYARSARAAARRASCARAS